MSKKIIIIKVKVKSKRKDLPDWGLGKGILATQEVVFDDKGKTPETIAYMLNNVYHDLVGDNIEPIFEEIKK